MRVRCALPLVAALLAACSKTEEGPLFEVYTGQPPEVRERLELGESRLGAQAFYYPLLIRSRSARTVRLEVRLEEAAPPGLRVRLQGETQVLRQTTARPRLQIVPPEREGPWSARITMYAEELPDWSYEWFATGEVVDRPPEGRFVTVRPPGLDLGTVEEGTTVPFAFALRAAGSESLRVLDWAADDPARVKLPPPPSESVVIEPGAEYQLAGAVVVPRAPGPFRASLTVRTDADRSGQRRIWIAGEVVTEYVLEPPSADLGPVYPGNRSLLRLRIRHREAGKEFTIGSITGHEAWLEVVEDGGGEPAATRELAFAVRRDAPLGPARFPVRLRILPDGRDVDWNVALRVVRSIEAVPRQLNFGRVRLGQPASIEVRLHGFAGRPFRVTAARAENGHFLPDPVEQADGGWLVRVHLKPGLLPNTPYRDRIWIETDDPDTPRLLVEAYVETMPAAPDR